MRGLFFLFRVLFVTSLVLIFLSIIPFHRRGVVREVSSRCRRHKHCKLYFVVVLFFYGVKLVYCGQVLVVTLRPDLISDVVLGFEYKVSLLFTYVSILLLFLYGSQLGQKIFIRVS